MTLGSSITKAGAKVGAKVGNVGEILFSRRSSRVASSCPSQLDDASEPLNSDCGIANKLSAMSDHEIYNLAVSKILLPGPYCLTSAQ
jgi:hypothetical protein